MDTKVDEEGAGGIRRQSLSSKIKFASDSFQYRNFRAAEVGLEQNDEAKSFPCGSLGHSAWAVP